MLLRHQSLLSSNEVKLLFRPYTRDDLQKIMAELFLKHIAQLGFNSETYKALINPRAFTLAAGKIDKVSGDIRVCFEIIRSAV